MRKANQICAAVTLALSLGGCGTLYKLDVNASSVSEHDLGNQYVILSSDPRLEFGSPEFEEYAAQLERALASRNYHRVEEENADDADLAIYIYTAISDPAKRYHEVNDAIIESDYDTTTTKDAQSVGGGGQSGNGSNGGSNTTRSVEPPPPDVLIGYEKRQFATTVYSKQLSVRAIDLHRYIADIEKYGREDAVPMVIWRTEVETTGSPRDLGEVIPIMIAAAQPYFGAETEDTVRVKLSDSDRRIQSIRGK